MSDFDFERSPNRIDELAERLFDAHLSEAEQAELFACLKTDSEDGNRFIEQVMLHALLRKELGGYRPATLIESLSGFSAEPAPPATVTKLPAWFGMQGWSLGTMFGAAVTFLVLLVLGGVWWTRSHGASSQERTAAVAAEPATATSPQSRPQLPMISSVQVKSGTSTLALEKIGTVVLEGQTEFSLLGPMKARLTRGSMKMRVTEASGHGFEVETPYGTVTDLGTEFGLNVSASGQTGLVVFDGSVDLRVDKPDQPANRLRKERLVCGEGVTFDKHGQLDRIMSIVTGTVATFQQGDAAGADGSRPVILKVSDNLRTSETEKSYEIVPGGLGEDALAYVDRVGHEWNGVTKAGMPSYLIGADYVKMFNEDRRHRKMEINVTLSCPAKLYVFYDRRLSPPDWLRKSFRLTHDTLGMDLGPSPYAEASNLRRVRGRGPGESIEERFAVWERIVSQPGVVKLGANQSPTLSAGMYGIAAAALNTNQSPAK